MSENIEINIPAGASEVLLKTAGKYCDKDIRVTSHFCIDTGEITLEEKIASSLSTQVTTLLPSEISPNAKIIVIEPSDEVISRIESITDKPGIYFLVNLKICLVEPLYSDAKNTLAEVRQGGPTDQRATATHKIAIESNSIQLTSYSIIGGKYRWKAYYWDE